MKGKPAISPETLAEAEKLAGVEFTDAERAQILQGIEAVRQMLERRKSVQLPNPLGPATGFDPRLPGMVFETVQRPIVRSEPDPVPLPGSDEDIAFAPVTRLSRWIEGGELSSRRLTEIYLERLKRLGPGLECVVTLTESRAMEQAKRADDELAGGDYRGPLHGIPWGAKDLLDTVGIPTTWGAAPYRQRLPDQDAEVVRRLERAGAVLVAKLSLGELAQGNVWFGGRTRNPWNIEADSGGSSAGSGAATAAALVGFAIGSETLGSITSPSSICGVTGLRPTFGRVARSGAMALCWSLDKLGPMARSVEDTALILEVLNGAHPGDPDSIDLPFNFDATSPAAGRSVGYIPQQFESQDLSTAQRAVLDELRACGCELVEVELPDLPYGTLLAILSVEAAAAFEELTISDRDDELRQQGNSDWPNTFRTAHLISGVELVQLQRVRRRVMEAMREIFQGVDAIVAPGDGQVLSFATNATGHPSLTLRAGFREDGTPAAVTLHGRLFDEGLLCRIGMALEARLGAQDRRPRAGTLGP
jgi:Asp-tRNA(Asn)/Glu-tRNA(Gln) amidotransferase A subunit family amidase